MKGMESMGSLESSEVPKDILEDYRRTHDRGRELLGASYTEDKFNSVMGSYLNASAELDQALDVLEAKLAHIDSEEEKEKIRSQWLQEEDLWTPALEEAA